MNDSRLPPLPHSRDTALSLAKLVARNSHANATGVPEPDWMALLSEALPWLERDAEHHRDDLRGLIARIRSTLAAAPRAITLAGSGGVEAAAEAIEREMHAYATRYARAAGASRQTP